MSANKGRRKERTSYQKSGYTRDSGTTDQRNQTFGALQRFGYAPGVGALDQALAGTRAIYSNSGANQYFPGQLVVPFAQQSLGGLSALGDAARTASPVVQAAAAANQGITSGNNRFLRNIGEGNPYQQQIYDRGAENLSQRVANEFASSGFAGGTGHARELSRGLADYGANLGARFYDTNQRNQLAAAGLQSQAAAQAGGIAAAQGVPAQHLLTAGAARERRGQQEIDAEVMRHLYNQQTPWQRALEMGQLGIAAGQAFGGQRVAEDSRQRRMIDLLRRFSERGQGKGTASNFGLSLSASDLFGGGG